MLKRTMTECSPVCSVSRGPVRDLQGGTKCHPSGWRRSACDQNVTVTVTLRICDKVAGSCPLSAFPSTTATTMDSAFSLSTNPKAERKPFARVKPSASVEASISTAQHRVRNANIGSKTGHDETRDLENNAPTTMATAIFNWLFASSVSSDAYSLRQRLIHNSRLRCFLALYCVFSLAFLSFALYSQSPFDYSPSLTNSAPRTSELSISMIICSGNPKISCHNSVSTARLAQPAPNVEAVVFVSFASRAPSIRDTGRVRRWSSDRVHVESGRRPQFLANLGFKVERSVTASSTASSLLVVLMIYVH